MNLFCKKPVLGEVKATKDIQIFIGTSEGDEVVQFLQADDLIAVSIFSVGKKAEKGIRCMVHLIKEHNSPIVVLPEDHPTSKRLSMVVSCGEFIKLDCNIQPGTHPEQDILCACEDLSGIEIHGVDGGVVIMEILILRLKNIVYKEKICYNKSNRN